MHKYCLKNLHTSFIGKRIDYYETIDSTHLTAKRIEVEELQDGMIILADNQTAGIGTHERKWYTGKGKNLSFDIILIPNCDMKKFNKLTIMIAECLVKVIKELYDIDLGIKEPNDVMCNNKKLAGILTETIAMGDIVKRIYIGIGININQTEFPESLENIATSLNKEFNNEFDREEILTGFLEEFESEYLKMLR